MGKLNKKIMLSLYDIRSEYFVIPYNMYHNYCKGTTKHGLRCGTKVKWWKKQEYCSKHRPKETKPFAAFELMNASIPNDVGNTQKRYLQKPILKN